MGWPTLVKPLSKPELSQVVYKLFLRLLTGQGHLIFEYEAEQEVAVARDRDQVVPANL